MKYFETCLFPLSLSDCCTNAHVGVDNRGRSDLIRVLYRSEDTRVLLLRLPALDVVALCLRSRCVDSFKHVHDMSI